MASRNRPGDEIARRDPGDDLAYDACPYCPFCGEHGGPTLMEDPGGGQLNWRCCECGAGWRMKFGDHPTRGQIRDQLHRLLSMPARRSG